ncbi:MAG: hypothetical protein DRI57_22105 [Deltaproteobacteria bacterium]|nr:MAG: hypothetical protein DRI57_22105 [Deltaproteobacteria bacterium]
MKWYSLTNLKQTASGEISAEARVMPDSPWFSGHFPGEPILPGIAQLSMVFDAIRHFGDTDLKIFRVKKVRFKQIIRPDDRLKIIAVPRKGDAITYSFKIQVREEVACSGMLIVGQKSRRDDCIRLRQ